MAISKEKFLRLFLDEFRENLLSAENQIILLKNDPGNEDALTTLLRTLHTIKGSTRMLQFTEMERLIHGTEAVFKGVREGRYPADSRLVRFFFLVADRLRATADSVEAGGPDSVADLALVLEACDRLAANEAFELASIPQAEKAASKTIPEEARAAGAQADAALSPAESPVPERREAEPAQRQHADSSIRVDASTIDRSITLANTLTIRQLRLRAASDQIDRLERRLTNSYRSGLDGKALRKELSDISRAMRQYRGHYVEQLFEIERGTQELRDAVIGMRMLPLSDALDRFPRMVEETALSLGKEVSLHVSGDGVRLDGTVLAKLQDPLIHIVRNAVDHGLETPAEREAAGKPRRGNLRIDCKTEGARISVTVSDDGRGIDYDAVRRKALSLWPEEAAEIGRMTEEDLVRFLFKPGFSTRSSSTELSGRGIGLDIVKTNVEAAKGQIHLESKAGQGSSFVLLLPVSASTMDGMFVLSAGQQYFIPATAITRILLVDETDCFRIRQKEMFNLEGVNVPLEELAVALQADQTERRGKKVPVLLVRGPAETIGVAVDRILGYDSLVYQPLPPGLRGHRLVQGVVFDVSFNVVPILSMWAVLDRFRSVRAMDTHRRFAAKGQQEKPTVLVVDDSVSTREIEIAMLELEGFSVVGAIDGVDALEKARASHFDLIVSDLNMPRMDGLKLLENLRSDETLKDVPVVFVTTVDDPETRKKAESLGASRYILKSSFEQDDLVGAVRSLIAASGRRR